jgi:hypothetical protein
VALWKERYPRLAGVMEQVPGFEPTPIEKIGLSHEH